MSPNVLSARDTNAQVKPVPSPEKGAEKKDVKSLEFHRQVLQSRMKDGEQYVTSASVAYTSALLTPRQRAKVRIAVRRHHEPCYAEAAGVQDQARHEEVSRPSHEEM